MKKNNKDIRKIIRNNRNLSKAIGAELEHFREYHPAKRFSKNLRAMLIDFLMSDGATEAWYLQDLLYDMEGLFELLDAIEASDAASAVTTTLIEQ